MAIPFLNNISLNNNEIQNVKLHNTGSVPNNSGGQIYFNTGDTLAKYYSNGADQWISLKEYSFANGTFVSQSISGTSVKPIVTLDLSASGTPSSTTFLSGDNTWVTPSYYAGFTIDADLGTTQTIESGDTLLFTGLNGITTEVVAVDHLEVSLVISGASNYVLSGNGTGVALSTDIIPFSTSSGSLVKQTTLGTIPVDSLTLVKQYIDESARGLVYQGGYDASTNTPNLDTPPTGTINKGFTYTVTVDGLFFTEQVRVGDVLIAEIDSPTTLADWTTVQNNIDLASLSQIGIGNVNVDPTSYTLGLSARYESGTALIGLDIKNNLSEKSVIDNPDNSYIPFYDNVDDENYKASISSLSSAVSSYNSYVTTISGSGAISHGLATLDVIVQLYDTVTYETIYADVVRNSTGQVTITFASTPTNPIRVLIQKIG